MGSGSLLHWVALALGVLLAAGGLAVVALALFRDRSRGRPRCPKCWYDMAGVAGLKCPECGREARNVRRLHKTRRRWRRAALGVAMLLLAGVTAVGAPLLQHGVIAGTPTWGYIAALPWIDSGPGLKELEQRVKAGTMTQWEYRQLVRRIVGEFDTPLSPTKKADLLRILVQVDTGQRSMSVFRPYDSWASREDIASPDVESLLIRLLEDPNDEIAFGAIQILGGLPDSIDRSAATLIGEMGNETMRGIRFELLLANQAARRCKELEFSTIVVNLGSPNAPGDNEFYKRVRDCDAVAEQLVPVLLEGARSAGVNARMKCIAALAALAPSRAEVQEQIVLLKDDPDPEIRLMVVHFVAQLPLSDWVASVVRQGMSDPEAEVRIAATKAAGSNGRTGDVFKPDLHRLLQNTRDRTVSCVAAESWVRIGGPRETATNVLLRIGRRAGGQEFTAMMEAFAVAGEPSKDTLAFLQSQMRSTDSSRNTAAACTWIKIGADPAPATLLLLEAEFKPDNREGLAVLPIATSYLTLLAVQAKLDIPTLEHRLKSETPLHRARSAELLAASGGKAAMALPKLRQLRDDPDLSVAQNADHAVKRIEWELGHPEEAVRIRENIRDEWP